MSLSIKKKYTTRFTERVVGWISNICKADKLGRIQEKKQNQEQLFLPNDTKSLYAKDGVKLKLST